MNLALGAVFRVLEQGLVYAVMAVGVYLSSRVLDFPDLTVDGSFPMGAAIAARLLIGGIHPLVGTLLAPVAGFFAGAATGILNTKLRISNLLAGILTMTALYSVNLRVMGRANVPLLRTGTVLTVLQEKGIPPTISAFLLFCIVVVVVKFMVDVFLRTEFGLALRAIGDNESMIRSLGVNTDSMKIIGIGIANALVALSGALVAQYQGFADIGMGIGTVVAGLASVIIGEAIIPPRSVGMGTLGAITGSVVYRLAVFLALRLGFAPTDLKLVTALLVIAALSGKSIKRGIGIERRKAVRNAGTEISV
ncbi:MAG TPA: ABC transporter permease [Firmicutes bacterium]|nr:ABC transporter permease [Bacillota bacterium]